MMSLDDWPAELKSGQKCPYCGEKKKSKRGEGASYVKDWIELPEADRKLLLYLINNYGSQWFEKMGLSEYKATTYPACYGRLSELVGCKLLEMKITKRDKQRTPAAYNTPAILYRVILANASKVLANGGRLDILRTSPMTA